MRSTIWRKGWHFSSLVLHLSRVRQQRRQRSPVLSVACGDGLSALRLAAHERNVLPVDTRCGYSGTALRSWLLHFQMSATHFSPWSSCLWSRHSPGVPTPSAKWCCFHLMCGAAFSSILLGVAALSNSSFWVPAFALSLVGGAVLPFSFCWVVEYIVFQKKSGSGCHDVRIL